MIESIIKGGAIILFAAALMLLRSELKRINTYDDDAAAAMSVIGSDQESECSACRETGHCTRCFGEGILIVEGADLEVPCPKCNGTGECPVCREHTTEAAGEDTMAEP